MRSILHLLSFVAAFTLISGNAFAETLCGSDEIIYFSCKLAGSSKTVSLCGSPFRDSDTHEVSEDFWLQYRFGSPKKLELVYPKNKKGKPLPFNAAKFQTEYARHNRGFDIEISFTNHGFIYFVSSLEGAENEKDNSYGVTVVPVNNNPAVSPGVMRRCRGLPVGVSNFSTLAQEYDQNK